MWALKNNILPETIISDYQPNTAAIYVRMNTSKYLLPLPRTELAKRHHSFSTTKLRNTNIPDQIKSSSSLSVFKTKYKTHLLNSI